MATAEGSGSVAPGPPAAAALARAAGESTDARRGRGVRRAGGSWCEGVNGRRLAWAALALVLAAALALRLWGIRQGLPYAYNADEDSHFVPRAIGMLTLGWNPHYFANPPAYTDLLRLLFTASFGGRAGVSHAFATDPAAVFTVARVCAAALGTLAVWLLYVAGARLFDRSVALLAAAVEAVAFLPVFYSHLALNDVPTLAPLTLSLVGTAGVLRKGRARDWLIAGVGLGLGCATKYTAGIALLPLAAAAGARYLTTTPPRTRPARRERTAAHGAGTATPPNPAATPPNPAATPPNPAATPPNPAATPPNPAATPPNPAATPPNPDSARPGSTPARPAGRPVAVGLALAGAAALASFLIADPYSVLDLHAFEQGIAHQSSLSGEAAGKLGASHGSGIVYYLWSLTWGLGWVPALAALGGALTVWRRDRRLGWVLVPAPLLYLAFMGSQSRWFGRWLLPIFPILCLLAALFAIQLARALAVCTQRFIEQRTHRAQRARPAERFPSIQPPSPAPRRPRAGRVPFVVFTALAAAALCAQGVVYGVHSGLVLSRADTRNLTRAWMVAHVPAGAKIVVEPIVPDEWVRDVGRPVPTVFDGDRWIKYRSLRSVIDAAGELRLAEPHTVALESYELTLAPALIAYYEREGYCRVVSGSAESGRAFADPAGAPHAVAYYRALARAGEVVFHASPYRARARPVAFNFDWSFDYYPLAYARPGPAVTVYRLHGGRCARG